MSDETVRMPTHDEDKGFLGMSDILESRYKEEEKQSKTKDKKTVIKKKTNSSI